ncbi:MAG: DUF3408 domain-containing protein [Tannerella sp.]|nr:DUF3408 domain-containing protein [Tannerella sp.]
MNKRVVEDIDETFLLNSIAEQGIVKETTKPVPEPAEAEKAVETAEPLPEKPKEMKESGGRRKRNQGNADYGSQFLGRNEFKTRQCVYISQRVHATISEIVRVISDREITVGGYIDSILLEHLETHRDEITELYNRELERKNRKNLIEF